MAGQAGLIYLGRISPGTHEIVERGEAAIRRHGKERNDDNPALARADPNAAAKHPRRAGL
jgi:hypothetical protein